jgi:heat shock protein HspQ
LLAATPAKPYMGSMTAADNVPQAEGAPKAPPIAHARFSIGDVVKHRMFDFRGVIFDIDPVFANSEEWYQSIP